MKRAALSVAGVVSVVSLLGACDEEETRRELPPPPVVAKLSVTKRGDGKGDVRTLPAGLICDVDCDAGDFAYEDEAAVTVVAEPGRNANFKSLRCVAGDDVVTADGVGANGEATVDLVTLSDDGDGVDWACDVEFVLVHTLQIIATQGEGSGRVTGTLSASPTEDEPKRVDCASDDTCVAAYFDGEEDTITATPDPGSVFVRWDFCAGDDPTNPVQTFVMRSDLNCRPKFELQ